MALEMQTKDISRQNFPIVKILPKAEHSVKNSHPWIFSGGLNKVPKEIKAGSFVRISDNKGNILGTGIYTPGDLSAVKIISFEKEFSISEIHELLIRSFEKRIPLAEETDSIRLLHGENDRIPGITMDWHSGTVVLRFYGKSLQKWARLISILSYSILKQFPEFPVENWIIQKPVRTGKNSEAGPENRNRILRGKIPSDIEIHFRNTEFHLNPVMQKGGIFNDLRNLKRYILENRENFLNHEVLNLFSNTGTLSVCLEKAGAKFISSAEISNECLDIHRVNLLDRRRNRLIQMDIFKDLEVFLKKDNKMYDTIIIDPPSLTAKESDKVKARKVYKKLFYLTLPFLNPDGIFIISSCSARIHENDFERIAREVFEQMNLNMKRFARLPHEIDHPVIREFPEGKYLKVLIFRKMEGQGRGRE